MRQNKNLTSRQNHNMILVSFITCLLLLSPPFLYSQADNNPAPQKVRLKDGEVCNDEQGCDCGHIVAKKGCKCEITVTADPNDNDNGIERGCPIPEVELRLEWLWGLFGIIAMAVVVYIYRGRKE